MACHSLSPTDAEASAWNSLEAGTSAHRRQTIMSHTQRRKKKGGRQRLCLGVLQANDLDALLHTDQVEWQVGEQDESPRWR